MSTTKPKRKPGIVVKDIGGEVLLYSADEEAVHILNPTAQLLWELCDGEHTVADMEQAIRAKFAVPAKYDVAQDVRQTLSVFAEKGLLQS